MDDLSLRPFAFVLAVRDFEATTKYFRDALGFEVQWTDASDWRLLSRDQVKVMIGRCPDVIPAGELGDHSYFAYLRVNDIDAMHAELSERGAIIRTQPRYQPYGQRDMVVGFGRSILCSWTKPRKPPLVPAHAARPARAGRSR